jgi:hypothetical protein
MGAEAGAGRRRGAAGGAKARRGGRHRSRRRVHADRRQRCRRLQVALQLRRRPGRRGAAVHRPLAGVERCDPLLVLADEQLVVSDTEARLEARYVIETDTGDCSHVHNDAIRTLAPAVMARLVRGGPVDPADPAEVYFRCLPRFECAAPAPALAWIGERTFMVTGMREPSRVGACFFELTWLALAALAALSGANKVTLRGAGSRRRDGGR